MPKIVGLLATAERMRRHSLRGVKRNNGIEITEFFLLE